MADANMGTGAVGGSLASIEAFGKRAGELARLILTGADIKSLPFEIRTDSVPTFNWLALQRWGIPENRLPPGSVVLHKPLSIWGQYRWYIIGAATVIALQALMIANLMLQRARRHRAEAELSESRQFMELATEAGGIGLWVRDLVRGDLWANPRVRSMLGFDQGDALKVDDVLARIRPGDRARMMSVIERAQETGEPFEVEFRTAIPGVPERWIASRGQFVRGPQGQALRRMGTMIDITERKRAEDKFRLAVEASPNALLMVDGQGKILLANGLTEQLFGYARAELIGQRVEMLVPERFRAEHPAHRAAFFGAPQARAMGTGRDLFARRKDGSEFLVEIGLNPIDTPEGLLVLTVIVDITERKRIESELQRNREELAHMTRVATVGELTASVAHELNQPLSAILSNAEAAEMFLMAEPPALDEVRDILADIRKDDQRASEIIRHMRGLLRKQELAPKSMEINEAVDEVLRLVSIDASARKVALKAEKTADLPRAWYDPVHFQQVLLNLVLNGMDAMAGLPEEKRQLVVRTEHGDNGSVKIAVADCGPGIPVDKLPHLFEPFFTTKKDGMGMGLSIARTIVEAHQGRIWAENNLAAGSTFYFTMPVEKGK
jgi:PAS domain S-box-containing protein